MGDEYVVAHSELVKLTRFVRQCCFMLRITHQTLVYPGALCRMNRTYIYDDETVRETPYAGPILSEGHPLVRDDVGELLLDS